jgi:hypothetical protein
MEVINNILKFLENRQIKKALNNIKKNNGKVTLKMYSKWALADIINSVSSNSNTKVKEIEFTNGLKAKFTIV